MKKLSIFSDLLVYCSIVFLFFMIRHNFEIKNTFLGNFQRDISIVMFGLVCFLQGYYLGTRNKWKIIKETINIFSHLEKKREI